MANADNGRLNERDQRIWHDYTFGGKTLAVLAEEHGVSNQRISQIMQEIREQLPPHDRQATIDMRLDQIRGFGDALMPGLLAGDKDAIASWVRLANREAKYLGLDAAEKVEISGGVRYEVDLGDG
jgi:hypothetical protein